MQTYVSRALFNPALPQSRNKLCSSWQAPSRSTQTLLLPIHQGSSTVGEASPGVQSLPGGPHRDIHPALSCRRGTQLPSCTVKGRGGSLTLESSFQVPFRAAFCSVHQRSRAWTMEEPMERLLSQYLESWSCLELGDRAARPRRTMVPGTGCV